MTTLFQEEKLKLIDVAIPLPIQDPYTYFLSPRFSESLQMGVRVRVPFQNRSIVGYVVGTDSKREVKKPKEILEVLDSNPVVSEHLLRLAKWIGEYYFSSWGEAISNMIPKLLKTKTHLDEPIQRAHESPEKCTPAAFQLTEEQERAFSVLKKRVGENRFSEIFLFGVTGSGKSELYIRTIKEVLKLGKGAICLVPEIALTE